MKKIIRNYMFAILIVIISTNSLSIYSTRGEFSFRKVLSPIQMRSKLLDSGYFSLQLLDMVKFRLHNALDLLLKNSKISL